ncbi:MAG: glycine zipper domain-containing protein [Methyloceanibacter sp.]
MKSSSWQRALFVLIGACSLIAGCGAPGSRQQAGTGIGAVAGGVTGGLIARRTGFNPVAGAVMGAVAGGIVGGAIGRSLDEEERRQLALASELAAEQPVVRQAPPKKVPWKRTDPKTNTVTASGWVVPKSEPYQRPDGTTCREVTQSVSKDGKSQSEDVTLCRTEVAQADGSNWVIPQ